MRQRQRMAQRNQRGGLLGGHDAGQPRRLQRIALLQRAGAHLAERRGGHPDAAARHRLPRGDRLGRDVDHLQPRPAASTCDSAGAGARRWRRARDAAARTTLHWPASVCARKNDRLSSDTVRSTLFSFTSAGTFSVPGEKFRMALMPAATTLLTTAWADRGRHRDHRDGDPFAPDDAPEVARVVDEDAGARSLPDLLAHGVEQRRNLEPLAAEARRSPPAPGRGCRRP